jgi:integrase
VTLSQPLDSESALGHPSMLSRPDEGRELQPSNTSQAKRRLRDALALVAEYPHDEAINRALDATAAAQRALVAELAVRNADRVRTRQAHVVADHAGAVDRIGRSRSPVTLPGYHKGRSPANKGQKYPASPPTTEEVAAMLARCDRTTPHGLRMFSWVLLVWRTGLRISESLALTETDLNPADSTVYVRCGKGGKSRLVGIDDWVWPELAPWLEHRRGLPVGALFCVIEGPTAGKAWSAPDVRKKLAVLARAVGIRHRVAPHQLRHAHAVGLLQEETNPAYIQRQLGHTNLAITTTYFQGLPQSDVIDAIRSRPAPQVNAMSTVGRLELTERSVTHA